MTGCGMFGNRTNRMHYLLFQSRLVWTNASLAGGDADRGNEANGSGRVSADSRYSPATYEKVGVPLGEDGELSELDIYEIIPQLFNDCIRQG